MRCRRMSINSRPDAASRSTPPKWTRPEVGSIKRDRHRTSVDLPDPLRPISTRISPGITSRLADTTAGMYPASFTVSMLGSPSWSLRNFSGSGP